MNIALIAHDKRKETLVNFVKNYEHFFSEHQLFSTGTTGLRVMENTNLQITRFQSGPLGGDQEVGALIAKGQMDAIFFFRDPLTSQPHEPDVNALLRLCDVYHIPVATNTESANAIIYYLMNRKK